MQDQPRTAQEQMRRTPLLVAHLMSESLGYFSPTAAALALSYHRAGLPDACEMYSAYAGEDHEHPSFDTDKLIDANRRTIAGAFRNRHRHFGYMAQPDQGRGSAYAMVRASIDSDGRNEPVLAGWF